MAAIWDDMDELLGALRAALSCELMPLPRPAGDGVVPGWGGVWFDVLICEGVISEGTRGVLGVEWGPFWRPGLGPLDAGGGMVCGVETPPIPLSLGVVDDMGRFTRYCWFCCWFCCTCCWPCIPPNGDGAWGSEPCETF